MRLNYQRFGYLITFMVSDMYVRILYLYVTTICFTSWVIWNFRKDIPSSYKIHPERSKSFIQLNSKFPWFICPSTVLVMDIFPHHSLYHIVSNKALSNPLSVPTPKFATFFYSLPNALAGSHFHLHFNPMPPLSPTMPRHSLSSCTLAQPTSLLILPRKPTQLSSSLLERPSILPFFFNFFFVFFL